MEESLHFLLMQFQFLCCKKMYRIASQQGLPAGQPKILEFLLHNAGREQKEIAGFFHIEPDTVTSLLSRMKQSGLIERRRENSDNRSYHIYLTEKGKFYAQQISLLMHEADEYALTGFDENERQQFFSQLRRICANLSDNKSVEQIRLTDPIDRPD